MYILKNSLVSIFRNKGRNILIGLIILTIACASTVTLAIRNTANSIVKSYEEAHDLIVTLSFDRNQLMQQFRGGEDAQRENIEAFNNIESFTIDDVKNYGDSEYLKGYYYVYSTSLNSDTISKATDSYEYEVEDTQTTTTTNTTTTITPGTSSSGNGSKTGPGGMDFGSMGERHTVTNNNTTTVITKSKEKFESTRNLTGDFQLDGYSSYNNDNGMYSASANTIITGSGVIDLLVADDSTLVTNITPSFILNGEEDIESFTAEIKEKGLNEYYTVNTNLGELQNATKSIENVKTFATTFLIITLIISSLVLFVINMINIRERKYEIGVFRTIGMSKFKLTLQFIVELLIVAAIALIIGAVIGGFLAKPVGNMLLENEIETSQGEQQQISENFGKGGMPGGMNMQFNNRDQVQAIDSMEAVVDFKVVMQLLGIGILLTLMSSLASMISIQRFSPLTILKERS